MHLRLGEVEGVHGLPRHTAPFASTAVDRVDFVHLHHRDWSGLGVRPRSPRYTYPRWRRTDEADAQAGRACRGTCRRPVWARRMLL